MKHPRTAFLAIATALACASCAETPRQAAQAHPRQAPLVTERAAPASPGEESAPSLTGKVTRIPLGTFFPLQQSGKALIFDVRPSFYYAMGHIPGAVNWPKGRFEDQLAPQEERLRQAVTAGRPVVLYCTDLACPDARTVATRLAERGHSVAVLEGGWEAWKAGELPIE